MNEHIERVRALAAADEEQRQARQQNAAAVASRTIRNAHEDFRDAWLLLLTPDRTEADEEILDRMAGAVERWLAAVGVLYSTADLADVVRDERTMAGLPLCSDWTSQHAPHPRARTAELWRAGLDGALNYLADPSREELAALWEEPTARCALDWVETILCGWCAWSDALHRPVKEKATSRVQAVETPQPQGQPPSEGSGITDEEWADLAEWGVQNLSAKRLRLLLLVRDKPVTSLASAARAICPNAKDSKKAVRKLKDELNRALLTGDQIAEVIERNGRLFVRRSDGAKLTPKRTPFQGG